jgi:hypothetical protein
VAIVAVDNRHDGCFRFAIDIGHETGSHSSTGSAISAQRSAKTVEAVLAQRPAAGAASRIRHTVHITISAGLPKPGTLSRCAGIGTCEMSLTPPKGPCVGGPVVVRVRASLRPSR